MTISLGYGSLCTEREAWCLNLLPEFTRKIISTLSITRQICNLAYNLYNGYCDDDGLDGYTPYHIFRSPLAAYFVCAIQMLYTAYFDMLYEPIIVEME